MSYTINNDMNKRYYANLNRFEMLWAFVNLDRLRDVVEIPLNIARLEVNKVTLEPLVDVKRKELDVFGCDDTYTCVDDEELFWRGTLTSRKQTYIEVELLPCNLDDELIRDEAIAMAELEERMIKVRERRDYDPELDEEVFIPGPR